ncbi:FkbM family methyltransferase [Terrimonas pollutisoli]|uniref:FkbM family methyltransferase n=1 Tax=Terrimonas pollutisoli TaxID=3034147 RepID=UPI0023ECFA6D|nr:FkbM family methyltransferase [Terrimonas sp. H1YJ31]
MLTKIKVTIKVLLSRITGNSSHLKKGVTCNKVWYGNTYGGFYICPDFLNEKTIVYSFGIGEDISFDLDIAKKHNCRIFGFDPTPKSITWMTKQSLPQTFQFFDFGLSNKSGPVDFFLPKKNEYVSGSVIMQDNLNAKEKITVNMKTLAQIMSELGHQHLDVLKMDIEGAEYNAIDDILNDQMSITQILIEFHDRFFHEEGKLKTKQAIEKLKSKGYEIFAVSDSMEEISFINKKAFLPS